MPPKKKSKKDSKPKAKKESKPKGLFQYYSYSIEGKAKRKSCQEKWRGGKLKSCRNVEVMKKKGEVGKKS